MKAEQTRAYRSNRSFPRSARGTIADPKGGKAVSARSVTAETLQPYTEVKPGEDGAPKGPDDPGIAWE